MSGGCTVDDLDPRRVKWNCIKTAAYLSCVDSSARQVTDVIQDL